MMATFSHKAKNKPKKPPMDRVDFRSRAQTSFTNFPGFITKGRNTKGQRKIRPNGIKSNFQKADMKFRPKIAGGPEKRGACEGSHALFLCQYFLLNEIPAF